MGTNNKHTTDIRLAIELARASDRKGFDSALGYSSIINFITNANSYSRTQHRLAEDRCNRPWEPKDYAKLASLHKRIVALCEAYNLTKWEIHSDPRAGCGLTVTVNGADFHLANSKGA